MKSHENREIELLDKFTKSAQYIVGLSTRQNVWEHLGKVIVQYFEAAWTAFVGQDDSGQLCLNYCSSEDTCVPQLLITKEIKSIIDDVLETGFISSHLVTAAYPLMIVFLPMLGERRTSQVMMVGHNTGAAVPVETLNIYLALAGLAGTMLDRLQFESELQQHQTHLADLVKARTADLAKAQRQNELILNSIGEGIVGVDIDGKISFVNPAASQLTGWGIDELIGRDAHETFHHTRSDGAINPKEQCPIQDTLANANTNVATNELFFRKDGTNIIVEFKTTPIEEEDQIIGAVLVFRDVTEETELLQARLRAEEDLREERAKLEVRVKERTAELSQTVSALHDEMGQRRLAEQFLTKRSEQLRQMTAELTLAEQRERQRLAQILHDGLQQILVGAKYRLAIAGRSANEHHALDQVTDLIDDAIETSRSLTAELSPPILLQGDFLSALEWLARWMHDKHDLNVSVTARHKIQSLPEGLLLLLFQAARELLFNVVKHAGVRSVHIDVYQKDGHIVMEVEDEGSGFIPDQLRTEGGQSGGVGLFGIKERFSYIGGKMEIRSAPGRGSRFRLTAPTAAVRAKKDLALAGKQAQVSIAISPQIELKPAGLETKIRIMLVDDHMVIRQGLAGLMRGEQDFEVAGEASDGESAIELAREIRPDVILMDIGMPGLDGIQATRIIHIELPEIRIIGFSMFQESEQEASIRNAGAVAYLTKSGPSEELIEAIRACVRVSEKGLADKPAKEKIV